MNKSIQYFTVIALSILFFSACSSDDHTLPEGNVSTETPKVDYKKVSAEEVKAELNSIVATLATLDASKFADAFAKTNIEINTNEFTVFAIEDARNEVPSEEGTEARALNLLSTLDNGRANNINIHHHIIAGKVNVNVTADKNYVYKTINDTEVIISKRNNVIYVNGVAMTKNSFYSNHKGQSHIYCVKNELPEEKTSVSNKKGAFDIQVLNINTADVKNAYSPSKDAYVIFFEKVGNGYNQIAKVRANDDGYATFFYDGKSDIYYKASNRGYNYIYKGFQVAGMYLDAKAVDAALPHNISGPTFQPKVGGIILLT